MAERSATVDRRIKAFLMRLEGKTYREIAAWLGGVSRERARHLAFSGARLLAVSRNDCSEKALEFVRRKHPDFKGDPLEIMNKRVQKLVAAKGGIEELSKITPIEMLKTKHCGRKSLLLITRALRDRGLDWRFDEESRRYWNENAFDRKLADGAKA